jgi:hypothetical protein
VRGCRANIRNLEFLQYKVNKKIPFPAQTKVLNYFKSIKKQTGEPRFPADLPLQEAVIFFLFWLIKYENEEDLGTFILSFNCFVPLPCFTKQIFKQRT